MFHPHFAFFQFCGKKLQEAGKVKIEMTDKKELEIVYGDANAPFQHEFVF